MKLPMFYLNFRYWLKQIFCKHDFLNWKWVYKNGAWVEGPIAICQRCWKIME